MPIELNVLTEKLREQGKTEEEIQNIVKYYDDYVEREDLLAKQQEQKLLDEEAANRSVVGSILSKGARGWASAAKGIGAFKNNIIFGAINAFNPDLTIEEKKAVRNILKNLGGVTFDPKYGLGGTVAGFEEIIKDLDKNVRLTESTGISDAIEKGNYSEAAELAVGGLLETTPSIAAAYGGYGAIALFGMSVAGNKFDEEFEANPEQSIQTLMLNAAGTGALESTFELATRGLLKYTGLIANKSGADAAKDFLKSGFTNIAKKVGVASVGEGIGEAATELSVMGLDAITLGKDLDLFAKETQYRLLDAGILGGLMGGGFGAVGSATSAARNRAEFLLTPIDTKKQMLSVANEISKLTKDLSNTQTEQGKKIISDKINKLENNLVRARAEVSKGLNSLNQEELSTYAKNQDEIIKLQQILSSNDPDLTKQTAEEKIKELQDQNYNLFVDGAKRHLAKNIETIKPAAEKLGVEIQEFATKQEFTENTGQDAGVDGFIQDNKIFINNERAAEVGAISVGSHELLHRIISSKLTNKNTKEELANGLINILREEGNLDVVQKRIDDSYKFDKNGNERKFDEYAEEYFTVFSDAIVKGDIQYKETVFQKILNFLNSFVNKFTPFKQAKFNTAQQAYDFVKDYSKNIQKGVVTEQAVELAGQQKAAEKLVRGSEIVANQLGAGIIRFDNTADFLGAIELLKAEGVDIDLKTNEKGEIEPAEKQSYGLIANLPNGDKQIIINNVSSKADGVLPADKHEVLHAFASKMDPNKLYKMGRDLYNSIINDSGDVTSRFEVDNRVKKALIGYLKKYEAGRISEEKFYEEVMAVVSDGLTQGSVKVKKTGPLINILNNFLENIKFKQSFKDGNQAIEFLKDFNRDVMTGKGLSKETLGKAGVKFSKTIGNQIKALVPEGTTKQQYDSQVIGDVYNDLVVGDRLNGLIRGQLNKFGVTGDNVFGKPINNFVEDVKQRLFEGSLTRFNPETNNDLGGFVVSELQQFRIGDVVNRYRREQAGSLDVQIGETGSIRTPVADEVDIDIKTTEAPRSELKQGLIVNNERLVDKKLEGEIEANTIEIIEGVTPEINDKDFKIFVKDAAQQKSFKSIKNKLKNIEQFLEDNINVLFGGKNLPIATLVAMERRTPAADRIFTGEPTRLTTQKQIDKAIDEGDFYVENEKQGPSKYPRKKPTIEQVKNFFFNVGASTKGTRKDGLVNAIAFSLFRDMAPGVMNRSDIMQEDIAKVSAKLVVDPTIKFSLSAKESSKVANSAKLLAAESRPLSKEYSYPDGKEFKIGTTTTSRINTAKKSNIKQNPYSSSSSRDTKDRKIYDTHKPLPENLASFKGETVIQGATRIINNFLLEHPRYYDFLFKTFTFGIDRSMFGIKPIWEDKINKPTPDKKKKKKKEDVPTYKGKPKAAFKKTNMTVSSKADIKLYGPRTVRSGWIKETKKENYVEKQEANLDDLMSFIEDFDSYLNKEVLLEDGTKNKPNTKDTWFLDEFGMHSQNSMSSPTRTSASAFVYEIINGNKNRPFKKAGIEEHFDPQNDIITILIGGTKDGNFNLYKDIIKASYMQGFISDANNDRVNEDFKSTKPDLFYEGVKLLLQGKLELDPGLLSVIRYTESDVNLNNLYYIPTKQTLGEYFFDANNLPLKTQKELIENLFKGELTLKDLRDYGKIYNSPGKDKQTIESFKSNLKQPNVKKYSKSKSNEGLINDLNNHDKALRNARDLNAPKKGISIFDFDDTVATSKSMIIVTMPDGKTKKITPAEFAKQHSTLEKQDAEFDFSEFNKVVDGKPGPLAAKIKKQIDKFGNKDVYILTARPQASASAIKAFLDGIGIKLPLKNITGLEDGTPQAKANWVISKAADGYNDFYFTDDVYKNVKAVQEALEVLDVKSKTRLAYADRIKKLDKDFNDILEATKGVASEKEYSKVKAELLRGNKGRYEFFIHASADDFAGMLQRFQGKGVVGDNAKLWFKKNLLDPFATAMGNLSRERIALMNDYDALKAQIGIVPKNLRKKMGEGIFTNEHAVRVYIWNKQGMEVPGLSKRDSKELTKYINDNKKFKVFADQLIAIHKADKYPKPDSAWVGGTITIDMQNGLDVSSRAKNLQVWEQNVDIIFSDKNLNKIEALYGEPLREALTGMIKRMKTGKNRSFQSDTLTGKTVDFLNGAVGGVMFFNSRSSVLQTISLVNFINYEDNNIFAASKAFANQKQFWKDFKNLMNSDFLIDRRRGVRFSLNENDIANIAQKHGARGVIARALEIGFLPTQIADSFAIAVGGASFYRNRINTYKKQGLSDQQAEAKAFKDFREIAEETQQSSRPDRVSQQQAGPMGRLLLAFQNVTMQFNRVAKKNFLDLKNKRRVLKSDGTFHSLNKSRQIQLSKMGYYLFVQNLIFNGLQRALFALYFGDIDEEDEKFKNKYIEIGNSMGDSILRGLGIFGGVVSVLKNAAIMHQKQSKLRNPKYEKVGLEILKVSPPISSKITKVVSALRTLDWEKEEIKEKGFSIDNPALLSATKLISAFTNAPLDRVVIKTNNIATALGQQLELWERIALLGGWQAWELGIEDKLEETKGKVKFGQTRQTRKVKRKTRKKELIIK